MKMNGLVRVMLILFFAAAIIKTTQAQQSKNVQYNISPQSKLTIEGSSTLHNFKVFAKEITGTLKLYNDQSANAKSVKISLIKVIIPVNKLDTDKKSMTEDMDEALKANKDPDITYTLNNINAADLPGDSAKPALLKTTGTLTIAGVSKNIKMDVEGYRAHDGTLHFSGAKKINMIDYGVTPPTIFFGIIKVGKDVNVNFNLTLSAQKEIVGNK